MCEPPARAGKGKMAGSLQLGEVSRTPGKSRAVSATSVVEV
jgi:hypothetical protein